MPMKTELYTRTRRILSGRAIDQEAGVGGDFPVTRWLSFIDWGSHAHAHAVCLLHLCNRTSERLFTSRARTDRSVMMMTHR